MKQNNPELVRKMIEFFQSNVLADMTLYVKHHKIDQAQSSIYGYNFDGKRLESIVFKDDYNFLHKLGIHHDGVYSIDMIFKIESDERIEDYELTNFDIGETLSHEQYENRWKDANVIPDPYHRGLKVR